MPSPGQQQQRNLAPEWSGEGDLATTPKVENFPALRSYSVLHSSSTTQSESTLPRVPVEDATRTSKMFVKLNPAALPLSSESRTFFWLLASERAKMPTVAITMVTRVITARAKPCVHRLNFHPMSWIFIVPVNDMFLFLNSTEPDQSFHRSLHKDYRTLSALIRG